MSEIFALMGPNGAGKTTLVRVLTGLIKPCEGHVVFEQTAKIAEDQDVSLVPQDIALYPLLSARENCLAFAKMSGAGWLEAGKAADRALALVNCVDIAQQPVRELSGGFRRRVNIAAALVVKPRLLILDEPTAGVDADARLAIRQSLSQLKAQGMSILLVTHDFDDADVLADKVGFLSGGRLVANGSRESIVKEFFGQRKRIEVELSSPPNQTEREKLIAFGVSPTSVDTVWFMFCDLSDDRLGVIDALGTRGFSVKEIKIQSPGLAAVYQEVCGQDK
jgi:ABC-2 type transport system ATP-binding protein